MKAIQFMIDDALLARVDADPEVRDSGRSAFLRRAVEDYLRRKRERETTDAYRRAYGEQPVAEEEELGPWSARAWPEDEAWLDE